MQNKKKWTRPLLTVLVRGKPEERVLGGCKMAWGSQGANNENTGCWTYYNTVGDCGSVCNAWQ
ncbi:MAG: hypothetical protein V1719_00015 [Patescibacteria group bacterium]